MGYSNRDTSYEQAKKSLKKFKGNQASEGGNNDTAIKFETFVAENEETLLAAGYVYQGWGKQQSRRGFYRG